MSASLLYFGAILVVLGTSVYVGAALVMLAFGADAMSLGILPNMVGNIVWSTMNSYILIAVPLFVLLGEILSLSGVADRMYRSLANWVGWLPGGLVHANIATCALFAAASGSSVATAATIGTVAQPTLLRLGYDQKLVLGSIAAGGTLGILIPPSINIIIYGALTNTSIGRLFAAGILPGIVLAITMSLIVIVISLIKGSKAEKLEDQLTLAQRIRSLVNILPVMFVFAMVMGSIYLGIATPTEAAAIGILAALLLAALNGTLSIRMLHTAFESALKTTAMILLVIVGAFILNFQLSVTGVPQDFANWVVSLDLGKYGTIWLLVLFYAVLGCFLEAVAMLVTTIAVVYPLVIALGFDPVWFGIFIIVLMEMALITPPVGLNLFVVQNIRIKQGSILDVYIGVLPFVLAMVIFLAILIYVPQLALWLPSVLF
ncbi:TRAP transporter large permease [Acuticoccus sp. MNP-M23]|uniref:TRAP transporter large permease n=1 Tax=Acuticoccus sp. MNP-M23 TaxID=3072793 RepID=UPI002814BC95|nr:TRAP transporter large permease [Acuticoccus sp. MNP-M23]WMS43547.1 TRAP transporter large permease [Acuticoccus sp. MNP-M23]